MTNTPQVNITIDNKLLSQTSSFIFLGTIIDNKLLWKSQIFNVASKISRLTGIIYKIRNSVTDDCLRQIYLSLAYPHLTYCSGVWGGAYKTYVDSLFLSQKKLIRTMFSQSKFANTDPLFINTHY